MRPAVLTLLFGLWMAPVSAQPPIHIQLQQAVENEDLDQAISILDQLIEAEDQDRADLEEYRQSLIQQKMGETSEPVADPPQDLPDITEPTEPSPEEARSTLLSLCRDEITNISAATAELFCQCTVAQLAQRHPLVDLVANPDEVTISATDSMEIYEICSPELDAKSD